MNKVTLKLSIVLLVGIVALIALLILLVSDFSPTITGAAVAHTEIPIIQQPDYVPTSAGCCNWDCEHYIWVCKTRDMQCNIGKPGFSCRY